MRKRDLIARRTGARWSLAAGLLVASGALGATSIGALAEDTSQKPTQAQCVCPVKSGSQVADLIAANQKNAASICPGAAPVILADPCAATQLVTAANSQPKLLEPLAQCLANVQLTLKATAPEKTFLIERIVTCAPPPFQVAYAVALVPESATPDEVETGGKLAETVVPSFGGFAGGGGTPCCGGGVSNSVP